MKKIKNKSLMMALVFFAWISIIFIFSAMNADISTTLTDKVLVVISNLRLKYDFINNLFLSLTENHSIFYIVRKMAHLFVFCILEIICFILLRTLKKPFFKSLLYSILMVIGYACLDEFHQLFVSGRSGQFTDVIIDSIGGFIGIFIILFFNYTIKFSKYLFNKFLKRGI